MYQFHLVLLLLLTSISLRGQIGVSTQLLSQDFPTLEVPSIDNNHISTMMGAGLSYWFRLKKMRWEFTPTVFYVAGRTKVASENGQAFTQRGFSFHLQNNLYLLDFKNDCNCPTFSKQGEWLRKGLFVYVAPGFGQYNFSLGDQEQTSQFGYAELGAGIDLGVSNGITITPMLGYRQLFLQKESGFVQLPNTFHQIPLQVKFTLRWDKRNFYR